MGDCGEARDRGELDRFVSLCFMRGAEHPPRGRPERPAPAPPFRDEARLG